ASLVRFGKDDLGPGEALVILGDLLDGLGQESRDRLLIRTHDRGESRGESDLCHQALLVRPSPALSLGGRGSEAESTLSGRRRARRGAARGPRATPRA